MKMLFTHSINKMKPFVFSVLFLAFALAFYTGCSSTAPVSTSTMEEIMVEDLVAQYAGQTLVLDEFERRHSRSVGGVDSAITSSQDDLVEFLERFVDFRLKVLYARELGLDQDSSLHAEISSYRTQLARPYLLERDVLDPILLDIYEKRRTMVDASHILLRLPATAPPEDTLAAFNKLTAIRDSVLNHGKDFGDMAFAYSEDPSAKQSGIGSRGRLGFFIGGMMVKNFEDRAYSTNIGGVSQVFRTQFGYHLVKVHDKKDKVPDLWVSQIQTRERQTTSNDTRTPRERLEDIRDRIVAGEEFEQLAFELSEERESGQRRGNIGKVEYLNPRIPDNFKEAVFALENPGDLTELIETQFGFHLVRLDRREEMKSFEDSYEELRSAAMRLPRVQQAEQDLAREARDRYGFTVDTTAILNTLDGHPLLSNDIYSITTEENRLVPVISIADSVYTLSNLIQFAENTGSRGIQDTLRQTMRIIDDFVLEKSINYEATNLENTDEEFKFVLDEFRDGLLLFKLMEDSVWTAAAQDTAALLEYFTPRANEFWHPDRYRIISLRTSDDSLLYNAGERLDNGIAMGEVFESLLMDTTISPVTIDTTYLIEPNNSIFGKAVQQPVGGRTNPIINLGKYVMLINDGIDDARPKTFEEARAELVSIRQEQLEQDMIRRLRMKFDAKTYPDMLVNAYKSVKTPADSLQSSPGEMDQ